jgi:hypothetical protein
MDKITINVYIIFIGFDKETLSLVVSDVGRRFNGFKNYQLNIKTDIHDKKLFTLLYFK